METSESNDQDAILILSTTDVPLDRKIAPSSTKLVDYETFLLLQLIFFVVLDFILGIFGTVTNIINIIIFIRQGLFSGGSTLNLFFLAIADLGVAFTNFLLSIGFAIVIADVPDLSWDPFDVVFLAIGWPHAIFSIINRLLTAYVAFERCMCVVVPFKVQRMFTPRRSLLYIMVIFTYGFVSNLPIFLTHGLNYVHQEGTNTTKLVLTLGPNRDFWHEIVYYANFFVTSFFSVLIVLVCTVITSAHVTTSKEWRKSMSSNVTSSHIEKRNKNTDSNLTPIDETLTTSTEDRNKNKKVTKTSKDKEKKLVKMISAISIIFLVCYLPELAFIVMRSVDDRIQTQGQYDRLAFVMYAVTSVTASINSGFNILVYYNMSSKYKKELLICCSIKSPKKKQ